jgi:hypothetical protein
MTMGLAYWIIMLLWFVLGLVVRGGYIGNHYVWAGDLLLFILFVLVGWKVFGAPLRG